MGTISYQFVNPNDEEAINLLAEWYMDEWNVKREALVQRISSFPVKNIHFHLIMHVDGIPVAAGGLHNHSGLIDRAPKFKIYEHWLGWVYTSKENRNKGYGALLCERIQEMAKESGLKEIFLYTYTAEALYKRLQWEEVERIFLNEKDIVVMKRQL